MRPPELGRLVVAGTLLVAGLVSQASAGREALPQRTRSVDFLQRGNLIRIDGAAEGDNAGVSVAGAGDVNGDGRADVVVGAHFADNNSRADSGSASIVFGRATPRTVDLARLGQAGIRIDGAAAGDLAGWSVAGAGDVNADGRADVLVGARGADTNDRAGSGSAYVVFGRAAPGVVDLAALGPAGFRIDGAAAGDEAGGSVAGAGDLNGDGRADVLVGARLAGNNGREFSGSAYVVFGRAAPKTVDLAALGQQEGFRIDGAAADDLAGHSVAAAGDVNGDGRGDTLVGTRYARNNGREFSGSAYIVFGRAAPQNVDLAALGQAGFRIDGAAAGDFAAGSVADAGDMNGDGRADVLVGARGADNNGRLGSGSAYVVFGKATPGTIDLTALGSAGFRIDGAASSDRAGYSVAGAGDPNGDGRADVLVGAHYARNNGRRFSGSAYLVFGKATPGNLDLAALGPGGFRIDGAAVGDGVGWSVSGAGDVNADGRADVLAGAPDADNNGRLDSGSAYVVFGKAGPGTVDLDITAPALRVAVRSPQRALEQKGVIVRASCNEACRLKASGAISIVGQGTSVSLRPAAGRLGGPGRRMLRLALSAAGATRLARLLDRGRRVRASVTVRARDAAGNMSIARRTAALRR
ncbi:MAG TPA: integrin alpha [Gaiellaceae bacterium]|nr:integrin alpha [Gaiellaceae bacterium]